MALCSAFGLSACVTPTTSTESTASTAIQAEQASEPIDVAASFAAPIVTADFNAAGGSFRDGTNIAPQPLALGVETVCSSTGLAAGAAPLDGFEMVFRQGSYRVRA